MAKHTNNTPLLCYIQRQGRYRDTALTTQKKKHTHTQTLLYCKAATLTAHLKHKHTYFVTSPNYETSYVQQLQHTLKPTHRQTRYYTSWVRKNRHAFPNCVITYSTIATLTETHKPFISYPECAKTERKARVTLPRSGSILPVPWAWSLYPSHSVTTSARTVALIGSAGEDIYLYIGRIIEGVANFHWFVILTSLIFQLVNTFSSCSPVVLTSKGYTCCCLI